MVIMKNWKGFGRERFLPLPGETDEDHGKLCQYSWCPGRNSNQAFPEYESILSIAQLMYTSKTTVSR
jgi:hypothetical protein